LNALTVETSALEFITYLHICILSIEKHTAQEKKFSKCRMDRGSDDFFTLVSSIKEDDVTDVVKGVQKCSLDSFIETRT